jgi:hypothetical protein
MMPNWLVGSTASHPTYYNLPKVALITHLDRETHSSNMSQSGKVVGKNQHYYVPATLALKKLTKYSAHLKTV